MTFEFWAPTTFNFRFVMITWMYLVFIGHFPTITSGLITSSHLRNDTKSNITVASNESIWKNETDKVFFRLEDYSVLAVMLIVSCGIGIFYGCFGKKQTTSKDFLLGGSSMGTFPMALSLGSSFITAIELLGNPAEMYVAGAQFWMICVAFVLVVPIVGQLYLPVFMTLRLTSCYEYLEVRFCKSLRVYASILYMIQMIFYTAVAVYAPAVALSDVTGLNTYLAVTLVYAVCIFYASQGGMKAVIMTDAFQTTVLLCSLAAILVLGAALTHGLDAVWDYARRSDRLHIFDMNLSPTVRHSFWSVTLGGTVYWTSMFGAYQASIQKYLSVESVGQARTALWVSAFSLSGVYSVNFVTGAILATYYADCDPIQAGEINDSDRLLPLFVVKRLGDHRGIPGLFVAGIFAASLGTVASGLNSMVAVACQDIATAVIGLAIPESKGAMIARWMCLGCGVISFSLIFLVEKMGPVLQLSLSFNGMVGGVSLGLFSLGMLFPWANSKGAVVGGIAGLVLVVTAGGGAHFAHVTSQRLPVSVNGCSIRTNSTSVEITESKSTNNESIFWLFRVSYLWYTGIGCGTTILVGLLISILTGIREPGDVPVDLLSPPMIKLLNALPLKLKKKLHLPNEMGALRIRNSSIDQLSISERHHKDVNAQVEHSDGVFYITASSPEQGHDNLGLGLDPEEYDQNTSV